jgi:hypothetical protein
MRSRKMGLLLLLCLQAEGLMLLQHSILHTHLVVIRLVAWLVGRGHLLLTAHVCHYSYLLLRLLLKVPHHVLLVTQVDHVLGVRLLRKVLWERWRLDHLRLVLS